MSTFVSCSRSKKRRRFKGICYLPTCQGDRFEFVHRVPRSERRRREWLEALNEPSLERSPYPTICGRHFRPEDYANADSRHLNRVAVPSLNLSNLSQLNICKKIASYRIKQKEVEGPVIYSIIESEEYQGSETSRRRDLVQQHQTATECEDYRSGYLIINDFETSLLGQCEENKLTAQFPDMDEVDEDVNTNTVAGFDAENDDTIDNDQSTIKMSDRELIVQLSNISTKLHLEFCWLRDFCRCEDCYDPVTHMRIADASQLSSDVLPNKATLYHDKLLVEWSDDHVSRYPISDLILSQTPGNMKLKGSNRRPWMAKHTTFSDDFNKITLNDVICNSTSLYQALDRLQRSGLLVISEVCTVLEQKPFMLELLLRRVFPHNNDCWIKEQRSKFHRGSQRLPHTNCTFLSESCGLQILGLTPGSVAKTIELTIVDGLSVVQQLRDTSGQTFHYLTQQKIPLVYRSSENFEYTTEAPMIQLHGDDGVVERIQFAPYHRANMTKDSLLEYMKALRRITTIVEQKQLQWTLLLRHDEFVILDNWRILWQIKETSKEILANVSLDCVYVERKHLLSRLNCLQNEWIHNFA